MIDIGINLSHDSFDHDRATVIAAAQAAGVKKFIVTGTSLTLQSAIDALLVEYPTLLRATAGVHPHHAIELADPNLSSAQNAQALARLKAWALAPTVVAVGECGLDYYRIFQEKNVQIQCFQKQIELSIEINKPLFCHVRDAHEDFMACLKSAGSALKVVVHCFTGSEAELETYLSAGFYIGITGWVCDERRGTHILNYIAKIPDNRLMIETDAPYLLPRTLAPKPSSRRNEPRFLAEIARVVAQARQQSLEKLIEVTHNTSLAFFGLENI
jgi:TatD DNase family protein